MEKEKFDLNNIDLDYQDIDQFVCKPDVKRDRLSMAFIGAGQGGGKIASEFCRFGYPLLAYNTCSEDLDSLQASIDKMPNHGKFERLDLEGDGGSAKSIKKGRQAIAKNAPALKEKLLEFQELREASFVWICVALGGGTGAGSLTPVAKILQVLRQNKKLYLDDDDKRVTVGVIAAVPDQSAKSKIRMNVASALLDLTKMHASGELGAVLLIDNQKMIDDFNSSYSYDVEEIERRSWTTDGNAKVARVITELALTTGCAAEEMFDVAEMLDIWGMPGFMTIGKQEINDDIMLDSYCDADFKELPKTFDERKVAFEKILDKAFSGSIFVEGVDKKTAVHGGLIVVSDGDIIRTGDGPTLKNVLGTKILDGAGMEEPHFGFISTDSAGSVKSPSDKGGRLFSMCVSKRVPKYIQEWCEQAKESKEAYNKARLDMQAMTSIEISDEDVDISSVSTASNDIQAINLADLFAGQEDLNKKREESLDDFDSLFAEIAGESKSKDEDDGNVYNGLFDL